METVAPHAGAWIETFATRKDRMSDTSHPTRVRGLKPIVKKPSLPKMASHPTRVRGLKQDMPMHTTIHLESHPTRVRGLKQSLYIVPFPPVWVAPHAGAWIETGHDVKDLFEKGSRTPRGCVD